MIDIAFNYGGLSVQQIADALNVNRNDDKWPGLSGGVGGWKLVWLGLGGLLCGVLLTACGPISRSAISLGSKARHNVDAHHANRHDSADKASLPTLTALSFASQGVGFLGTQNNVYRTMDGGSHWILWYRSPKPIRQLDATGPSDVWLLAGTQVIRVRGLSSGTAQFSKGLPKSGPGNALSFFGPHGGFLLIDGQIYHLDVTSTYWRVAGPPTTVDSMAWVTGLIGFAASGKQLWRTQNGGHSWTRLFAASVQGSGWYGDVAANSSDSIWFLVSGGVQGMSQTGYVLWHGTDNGARWQVVTDEPYLQSNYPHGHPFYSQPSGAVIMRPGLLTTSGVNSVYLQGWHYGSPGTNNVIILTNSGGSWHNQTVRWVGPAPRFTAFVVSWPTTGYLVGTTPDRGIVISKMDDGQSWGLRVLSLSP